MRLTTPNIANRGFTLIEMMIAMALSLLILAGVLGAYVSGAKANINLEQRIATQGDAHFALSSMAKDLRMSGSFGCAVSSNLATVNDLPQAPAHNWEKYNKHMPGVSNNKSGVSWIPAATFASDWLPAGSTFIPTSGALIIQYGAGAADAQIDANGVVSATVSTTRPQLNTAAVLALASCSQVALFKPVGGSLAAGVFSITPQNITAPFTQDKRNGLSLMRLVTVAYVLGTPDKPTTGEQPGLYMFELGEDGQWTGPKQIVPGVIIPSSSPVVPGLASLALKFGVSDCVAGTPGAVHYKFYSGDNVPDWDKVSLVHIDLSMRRNGVDSSGARSNHVTSTYGTTIALRGENLCITQTISD